MKTKAELYLEEILEDVVHVDDPVERLRKIRELEDGAATLGADLRAYKREAILELRRLDPPKTWPEIGELLGVTAQRAEQLSRT